MRRRNCEKIGRSSASEVNGAVAIKVKKMGRINCKKMGRDLGKNRWMIASEVSESSFTLDMRASLARSCAS